jgi:hypothetical protein
MMKKIFLGLRLSLLFSLFLVNSVSATTQDYLMWGLPSEGVMFPVYVYQAGKQVGFIPSLISKEFVGEYTKGKTSGSYKLYYKNNENWYACDFVLSKGSITSNSCGAIIVKPTQKKSNVYTLALGGINWNPTSKPKSKPVSPDYSQRAIIFKNETKYPMIQIGEGCTTASTNNCQTKPIIATINQGESYTLKVGLKSLVSSAFYMSSYCTAGSVAGCGKKPKIKQCNKPPCTTPIPKTPAKNWVYTGGYFVGQTTYATKIEPTILAIGENNIPVGASNIDVSAVDGYNVSVLVYPATPKYCTYTIPPEGSSVQGAGYYLKSKPLASIASTMRSLETMCKNSSQLPGEPSKKETKWNLEVLSPSDTFEGCMSPCQYATVNNWQNGVTQKNVNQFCCQNSYNTFQTCIVPSGNLGANTSTYNQEVTSNFQNVYGFAFGDAGDNYGCPGDASFVVEFVSVEES